MVSVFILLLFLPLCPHQTVRLRIVSSERYILSAHLHHPDSFPDRFPSVSYTHLNKLKFIQLSRVDANQILAVIVAEGNVIRNKLLPVCEELSDESILKLNICLLYTS